MAYTVQSIREEMIGRFRAAGIDEAVADAEWILQSVLNVAPHELFLDKNRLIEISEEKALTEMTARRLMREPVSKILGTRDFWKYSFKVSRETLDPRQDSERVIEVALERATDPAFVIDAGTGTGCLLLSVLGEWPQATGYGIDASAAAIEVASENARRLGFDDRATFKPVRWEDFTPPAPADVVISNPPYIALAERAGMEPEVLDYDPPEALFAGEDGLEAYRSLMQVAPRWLRREGVIILEIGYQQAAAVTALLAGAGFVDVQTAQDLGGRDRVVSGVWPGV